MQIKTRIKKIADDIPKSSVFCFGLAAGGAVVGFAFLKDVKGLEIVDINLIHDNVQNVDFLCVARANGSFQNFLFQMNK